MNTFHVYKLSFNLRKRLSRLDIFDYFFKQYIIVVVVAFFNVLVFA